MCRHFPSVIPGEVFNIISDEITAVHGTIPGGILKGTLGSISGRFLKAKSNSRRVPAELSGVIPEELSGESF